MFETIGYEAQKTTVIEWLRYAPLVAKSRELRIPFILGSDNVPEIFGELRDAKICSHALMSLLGKGFRWWKNCLDHNDNMTRPMHTDHFEQLKKEAEPIATRSVRETTGETTLRDTKDFLFLPSYFTVRGCYAKFCLDKRGVRISTTNKGTVKKTPAIDGEDATNDVSYIPLLGLIRSQPNQFPLDTSCIINSFVIVSLHPLLSVLFAWFQASLICCWWILKFFLFTLAILPFCKVVSC
jgi:hypothetical protein